MSVRVPGAVTITSASTARRWEKSGVTARAGAATRADARTAANAVDFVSRFFAPAAGVPEDPVTGSAHCALVPYWAAELGRTEFTAAQVGPRGGDLRCRLLGDRVLLGGEARTVIEGTFRI